MFSKFFINRPIAAWVFAIIVMMLGIGGLTKLPIAQYPDIAPPQIIVSATYPGASPEVLQSTVTTLIEEQLTSINGMIYFSSSSNNSGQATIRVTFAKGIDPDIAQVQVQNKVQQAISRLPSQVQQQGLTVNKTSPDYLLVLALYDKSNKSTNYDVADYLVSNMQDRLARLPGISNYSVFGAQYAVRIWLDPAKLYAVGLIPSDISSAITNQNVQVASGQIGMMPSEKGQMLTATITSRQRFTTIEQFRTIVVKTLVDGSKVYLRDVARVEMGAESYTNLAELNGHPAAGIALVLAPGADALATAELVKKTVAEMSNRFPPGYAYIYPRDSTEFIEISVGEVEQSLIIAIILVVVVMFIFLQGWRPTLIPTIAVPVVLLGTFGILWLIGYSINTLTLFSMVLAIGLLVDDAIVVVENIERVLAENPEKSVRDATIESMDEIQVALISIALVLSAVFLPMAFFGGSVGVIYRQFSVTIISAMTLSVMVALILTPAIAAGLLRRHSKAKGDTSGPRAPTMADDGAIRGKNTRRSLWEAVTGWVSRAGDAFNRGLRRTTESYGRLVAKVIAFGWWMLLPYIAIVAVLGLLFVRLPSSFLPVEDQGYAQLLWNLPPGATIDRTQGVANTLRAYFTGPLGEDVRAIFTVSGQSPAGTGQNTGLAFVLFKPWDQRTGKLSTVPELLAKAQKDLDAQLRDAQFYAISPPPVQGFGQANGFTFELLNNSAMSLDDFTKARDQLLAAARADPRLSGVRLTGLPAQPGFKIDIDTDKVAAMQISQSDVNSTISAAFGGNYINDFTDRDRVKRVYMQGDAPFRSEPSDIGLWYVRSANGDMAPLNSVVQTAWNIQPILLTHYNGLPSYEFMGVSAPGFSSGEAMNAMAQLATKLNGTTFDWSALSYQEIQSGNQAPLLYGLSIIVIFLCLAALYESWSVPFAVLLVIPLGLFGSTLVTWARGLPNDIYFQVGLLTTMGLSAKNAILIIEFAVEEEKRIGDATRAAIRAAEMRLRPILMTSIAFILGVFPLAIATGAGANSRIEIGTTVIGGMFAATTLEIFLVPGFFVLLRRLFPVKTPPHGQDKSKIGRPNDPKPDDHASNDGAASDDGAMVPG